MNKPKPAAAPLRNVEVRALRPHANSYGAKFEKAKGDTYRHPRPQGDLAAGLIELVEAAVAVVPVEPVKPAAKPRRTRKSAAAE